LPRMRYTHLKYNIAQNGRSNYFVEGRRKDIRQKYEYKLHIIILFCVLFFVIASSYYPPFILPASFLFHLLLILFLSWSSRLLEFQKIMYRSSQRDTVTNGKNEYNKQEGQSWCSGNMISKHGTTDSVYRD
jgi:hypothetical protein